MCFKDFMCFFALFFTFSWHLSMCARYTVCVLHIQYVRACVCLHVLICVHTTSPAEGVSNSMF